MSKSPIKKVETDAYPVDKLQIVGDSVFLEFKSGQKYKFDLASYKAGLEKSMTAFAELKSKDIEKKLLTKVNAVISKNENDNAAVVKLSGVTVKRNVTLPDGRFDAFETQWKSAVEQAGNMANNLDIEVADPDTVNTLLKWMSQPYATTSDGLDISDVRRVQSVRSGDEEFPIMYFYTNLESGNGCETWYKAIDPVILFGTPVDDFE